MIIKYDKDTGKMYSAIFGQDDNWTAEMMTDWETTHSGEGCVKITDGDIALKYYNSSSNDMQNWTDFSLSQNKTTLTSNGTDYIEFTSVPEDTKIYVDGTLVGTMDSSGTYRMGCTDSGTYGILFKKYAYEWHYVEAIANDNF